ncbi:phospholipase D family protein [Methylocystis parvus]|uniref:NgoFVII family restriction endonuclease n=1 Tax=Methylocystis parvus TaxID=134 RepID=A0A6B8M6B1_9HYPH|nr:phospholipase D family protein [Methylocystis parvus]QGM96873.1 NgoFVII family restriction endonuclease [Methylocystis parvus]WBJ99245.1 phospholipase D family protein [Methylocystis parvus OBBP]
MDTHIYATSKAARDKARSELKDAYVALVDNTKWSKSVIFISAYYGVDFANELFRFCKSTNIAQEITLVFAAAANSNRSNQITELRNLRVSLRNLGYAKKRINIRIATDITFLHTKIFAFTGPGGHKRYMLGSANFSSAAFFKNDEVLILERGRHDRIESYIMHVITNSSSIDEASTNSDIKDWRGFFREGFLYFKPSRQVPYTVNCFVGDDFAETVNLLEKATGGAALEFHDPGGLGSLNLALLMRDRTNGIARKRVSMSAFAIETAFGLWVPSAYVDQVETRIESSSQARLKDLREQGLRLNAVSDYFIKEQIRLYLDEINLRLEEIVLSNENRTTIDNRIRRGLKRLIQALTDESSLKRLSRPLMGVPVPEFWEDEQSGNELFETFAEYVAYKLSMSSGMKRQSSIISHLATKFGLCSDDDALAVRQKMEDFFENGAWPLNNWPKAVRHGFDDV